MPEPLPVTVKLVALCPVPPAVVTLIVPVVAPVGTVARICVAESIVNRNAAVPLNMTLVAPVKSVPVIVTSVLTPPLVGLNKEIVGAGGAAVTVKSVVLWPVPAELLTLIFPVVALEGTVARSCVSESTVKLDAAVVLKRTAVTPVKFAPVTVTSVVIGPLVGVNEVTVGGEGGNVTVKFGPLRPVPPLVVTLILPVVAPVGTVAVICVAELTVKVVAEVVLNFTSLAPVKSVPLMVTCVPTGPLIGVKEEIVGVGGIVTVKFVALCPVPPPVVTLIKPVVAPAGTVAVI